MWKDTARTHNGRHRSATEGLCRLVASLELLLTLVQDMGGAEGKVAYIGELASMLCPGCVLTSARYRRHLPSGKNHGNCRAVWRSAIPEPMFSSLLISTVDPDQACENIVYARAQNSEVRLKFLHHCKC